VVSLLQEELLDRGINLRVRALANDTVGTMEAAAYRFPDTAMGVILGTGTNAAYVEKAGNVPKWAGAPCDEMVINTEWGNLGMGSLMNAYDEAVDRASDNPSAQQYEKMISGLYLGVLTYHPPAPHSPDLSLLPIPHPHRKTPWAPLSH
jgi:hexokinase